MKDFVLLQARYNQYADNGLLECLEKIPFDTLQKNVGTYFNNILATMEHIVGGHVMFFSRFFIAYTDKPICINEMLSFVTPDFKLTEKCKADFASLKKAVQEVDSKIIEIIENINDFESMGVVKFPQVTFNKKRGELILAALTHATHHRGEISAMLDILGVTNDFAVMFGMK